VDRMVITRADPPGATRTALFVKRGPVLLGEARIDVTAVDEQHARVTWTEDVWVAHLPVGVGRALLRPFLGLMVGRALGAAAREVGAQDRRPG
jgi:hypothetical protein